ncbi:hypothetical protein RhiirA1_470645 [Rhizophagus irregularis]|uniref:Uncharacterized protein n=1 Tax=Rhizophagus irregularis TaxID=588596 RepID=A0A2N0R5S2_9GLOM|nr:hypothetical protein RhiirA1_470645 [Rhizophagus irregularis]
MSRYKLSNANAAVTVVCIYGFEEKMDKDLEIDGTKIEKMNHEEEIYGLKTIYDLQLESISKNIIYQANGNEKLRRLFKIKMMQEQKNLDCKMYRRNIYKGVNCWIRDAINLLKSGDMSICIHEIVDKDVNHRINGGNVEVIDLMSKKEILKSAQSRRTKGGLSFKGKVPKWFTDLEKEVLEDKKSR